MDYQYRGRVVKTYPKRSYYSELIWANQPAYFLRSNLYAVCKKRTSEFWKTRTERYGVKNQSIVEYERPKYLAPEERWIIFNEEHGVVCLNDYSFRTIMFCQLILVVFDVTKPNRKEKGVS